MIQKQWVERIVRIALRIKVRHIAALTLVVMGVYLCCNAEYSGAGAILDSWGISPHGYGFILLASALFFLTRKHWRGLALAPFAFYITALLTYALQTSTTASGTILAILCIAFFLMTVRSVLDDD